MQPAATHELETDAIHETQMPSILTDQSPHSSSMELVRDRFNGEQGNDAAVKVAHGVEADAMLEERNALHQHIGSDPQGPALVEELSKGRPNVTM